MTSKHKREECSLGLDATSSLEIKRDETELVMRQLGFYVRAGHAFGEQARLLVQSLAQYLACITNDSDPEVSFSRKGAQKLKDFIERLHNILDKAFREVEEKAFIPMQGALATMMTGPRESRKVLEKSAAQLEAVRRRYRETVASKKTTPAKIREAQDEQDGARASLQAAEREVIAQSELSNAVVCSQPPRMFSVFFKAFDRVFRDSAQLMQDSEPYFAEFQQQLELGERRPKQSDGGGDALAELSRKVLETEKQNISQLSILVDVLSKMTADQASLHITAKEITAIFPELFEIFAAHSDMASRLEKPPAEGETVAAHVAAIMLAKVPDLVGLYVPFVRSQSQSAADLKRLKRLKGYSAFAQQFEQRFGLQPGGFDISALLAQAGRHMHKTKLAVQNLFEQVPPEDKGWASLHDAIEALTELLDKLDDVRIEAEHEKQLERIKERLPDLEEGILELKARVFLYDSEITVESTTGTPPLVPASVVGPPLPPSSEKKHKSALSLFLFHDYLVLAERAHHGGTPSLVPEDSLGSSSSATYRSITKLPLYSLAVEEGDGKISFRVLRGKGTSAVFVAPNEASLQMWLRVLGSAINERHKTQVFGVPLADIMSRPAESGRAIPAFLEELMAAIESEKMVRTEGIYRMSTRSGELAKLQGRLDMGKRPQFPDAHTTANALKLWIRMLPEPLMGGATFPEWITDDLSLRNVQMLVSKLPPLHIPVIAAVVQHLRKVAAASEYNMMSASNLCIVFMPSLIRPLSGQTETLAKPGPNNPIQILMDNFDKVFVDEQRKPEEGESGSTSSSSSSPSSSTSSSPSPSVPSTPSMPVTAHASKVARRERLRFIRASGSLKKWEASAKFLSGHRQSTMFASKEEVTKTTGLQQEESPKPAPQATELEKPAPSVIVTSPSLVPMPSTGAPRPPELEVAATDQTQHEKKPSGGLLPEDVPVRLSSERKKPSGDILPKKIEELESKSSPSASMAEVPSLPQPQPDVPPPPPEPPKPETEPAPPPPADDEPPPPPPEPEEIPPPPPPVEPPPEPVPRSKTPPSKVPPKPVIRKATEPVMETERLTVKPARAAPVLIKSDPAMAMAKVAPKPLPRKSTEPPALPERDPSKPAVIHKSTEPVMRNSVKETDLAPKPAIPAPKPQAAAPKPQAKPSARALPSGNATIPAPPPAGAISPEQSLPPARPTPKKPDDDDDDDDGDK